MNAISTADEFALPVQPFDRAGAAVDEWRGRCQRSLNRAEQAVTECLAAMLQTKAGADEWKPIHLIGQKYGMLEQFLDNDPADKGARKALDALRAMKPYHELRVMLCHADVRVFIDRRGRWTSVWHLAKLDGTSVLNLIEVVTQEHADDLARGLKAASDRLSSLLANLMLARSRKS